MTWKVEAFHTKISAGPLFASIREATEKTKTYTFTTTAHRHEAGEEAARACGLAGAVEVYRHSESVIAIYEAFFERQNA